MPAKTQKSTKAPEQPTTQEIVDDITQEVSDESEDPEAIDSLEDKLLSVVEEDDDIVEKYDDMVEEDDDIVEEYDDIAEEYDDAFEEYDDSIELDGSEKLDAPVKPTQSELVEPEPPKLRESVEPARPVVARALPTIERLHFPKRPAIPDPKPADPMLDEFEALYAKQEDKWEEPEEPEEPQADSSQDHPLSSTASLMKAFGSTEAPHYDQDPDLVKQPPQSKDPAKSATVEPAPEPKAGESKDTEIVHPSIKH